MNIRSGSLGLVIVLAAAGFTACTVPPSKLSCTSTVTTSRPQQRTVETVTVLTQAGARAVTTAKFSTTRYVTGNTANARGTALMSIPVGLASPAFKVNVATVVSKGGQTATCTTSFIPKQAFGVSVGTPLRYAAGNKGVMNVTVNGMRATGDVKDFNGDPIEPQIGGFIDVEITAAGVSGSSSINPADFTVKTPDGTSYGSTTLLSPTARPSLNAATLTAGKQAHGFLTFDIPLGGGAVVYSPGSSAVGSWKIPD